jgi:hypothetical protein
MNSVSAFFIYIKRYFLTGEADAGLGAKIFKK